MASEPVQYLYVAKELLDSKQDIWINPIGGYGDILMISSALYSAYKYHGRKFNMVRRSQYTDFLSGHPAIDVYGFPPKGSVILGTDYWSRDEFNLQQAKALDILVRIFGGVDPFTDKLFLPLEVEANELLIKNIPWKDKNVIISPYSESIRKMMNPIKWHIVTEKLLQANVFVLQVGKFNEMPIKGAYSLLGVTTPRQLLSLIRKVDFVITVDNFIMHAAEFVSTPTISLFGPTLASQYGYADHFCLQANWDCCKNKDCCLGFRHPENYTAPCPLNEMHCMNQFSEQKIVDIINTKIENGK